MIFIERYAAAPLVALLIAHGLVNQQDSNWTTEILGQVIGGGFIILVYILTHQQQVVPEQEAQSIWTQLKNWAIKPDKSDAAAPAAETETT